MPYTSPLDCGDFFDLDGWDRQASEDVVCGIKGPASGLVILVGNVARIPKADTLVNNRRSGLDLVVCKTQVGGSPGARRQTFAT